MNRHRWPDDDCIVYDKWLWIIILLGAATFLVSVNAAYIAYRNRESLERIDASRADLSGHLRRLEASVRRLEQR